jgi:hypothetical protein
MGGGSSPLAWAAGFGNFLSPQIQKLQGRYRGTEDKESSHYRLMESRPRVVRKIPRRLVREIKVPGSMGLAKQISFYSASVGQSDVHVPM